MRDTQDKNLRCPPEPPVMSKLLNSFNHCRNDPYIHSYDDALSRYYEKLYEDYMMHYQEEYDRSQEEILPPMFGFWDEKMHEYYDHYYREN